MSHQCPVCYRVLHSSGMCLRGHYAVAEYHGWRATQIDRLTVRERIGEEPSTWAHIKQAAIKLAREEYENTQSH